MNKATKLLRTQLAAISLLITPATCSLAQVQINAPFSMPDVNMTQVGDRVYAFGGTDAIPFADDHDFHMPYWRCFSSDDLVNWRFESSLNPKDTYMGKSDGCWGGHGIKHNGKWYWYFANKAKDTGVAVADSPAGPWKDALKKPLLPAGLCPTPSYDSCAINDDDGKAYLLFGVRAKSYHLAELNDDMISLKTKPVALETLNVPESSNKADAPFMHKHAGFYYLSWRTGYGFSKSIYGPYTYLGDQTASGHLGFFDFNNQNFVNYTTLKKGMNTRYRFCSLAYVQYFRDGRIAPMEPLIKQFGVGQYDAQWPRIEAEWYMGMSKGPVKDETSKKGFEVRNLRSGDVLRFPNIQNCPRDPSVEITYSCANAKGGFVSVRAYKKNGPEIGRAAILPTGSWDDYGRLSVPLDNTVPPGTLSLAFVIEGTPGIELIRMDAFNVRSAAKSGQ